MSTKHIIDCRVQVFSRSPVLGEVKTRLQSVLSAQLTMRVHEALLRHACQVADAVDDKAELWLDWMVADLPDYGLCRVRFQSGDDIGARMRGAAEAALAAGTGSLIMGSDCPMLDANYVRSAIGALAGAPVVLAPAEDGGYALIAMRLVVPEIFTDMPWSTEQVCNITVERLERAGVSYKLLPVVRDIDRTDDLTHFLSRPEAREILGAQLYSQCCDQFPDSVLTCQPAGGTTSDATH